MLRNQPVRSDKDEIRDRDAGEMDGEGVHPVVIWHDWVSDGDVARESVPEAQLPPVLEGAGKVLLRLGNEGVSSESKGEHARAYTDLDVLSRSILVVSKVRVAGKLHCPSFVSAPCPFERVLGRVEAGDALVVLLGGLARLKADALDAVASACACARAVVNESWGHLV